MLGAEPVQSVRQACRQRRRAFGDFKQSFCDGTLKNARRELEYILMLKEIPAIYQKEESGKERGVRMEKNGLLFTPFRGLLSARAEFLGALSEAYAVAALVAPRGWSMEGRDGGAFDGREPLGLTVGSDLEGALASCDALLVPPGEHGASPAPKDAAGDGAGRRSGKGYPLRAGAFAGGTRCAPGALHALRRGPAL